LAQGSFDVHVAFRYRVLLPFMAKALALALQKFLLFTGDPYYRHHLPLGTAFFLINSLFMSLAGLVLYKTARFSGASFLASLVALVAVLTSGYASYFTGVALTDSLYFLCLVVLFYAILTRDTRLLFAALLFGPLAKESFWLFLPFILLSLRFLPPVYLLLQLAVAGLSFWGLHWAVDELAGPTNARPDYVLAHLAQNIGQHLNKLSSRSGLLALFSTYGMYYLLLVAGFRRPGFSFYRINYQIVAGSVFLGVVILHVLLSGDIGRMWYFSAPVFALAIAKCADRLPGTHFLAGPQKG
jgi:hypothetical protein